MTRIPILVAPTLLAVAMLAGTGTAQQDPKPSVPATKLTAPTTPTQPPVQDEVKKLRAEKLAKPVFKQAAWRTDYDQARAEAKKDGKLILVYFTRSYAP